MKRTCSVCGIEKDVVGFEFSDKGNSEDQITRTNCKSCYEMPWEDMQALSEETKAKRKEYLESPEYKKECRYREMMGASLSKEELIESLSKLPDGSRIVITQSGFYAQGRFAYFEETPRPYNISEMHDVYSIGYSEQDY